MPRNNNRGGRNNNPSGRNQYSDWGVMDMARERPIAAVAAAGAAAAAGLFLWARRAQISDQLSNLTDQIGEWTENMGSGSSGWSQSDDTGGLTTSGQSGFRSGSNPGRGMSETGGGNASLGKTSGGGGSTASASGRGRAKST